LKTRKTPKAEIIVYYVGGAKAHASTTLTKEELETALYERIEGGHKSYTIDTVNEDEAIEDDSLTILFDKLLFYTVFQKNASPIISIVPKNNGLTQ
jgi:hypothetical protein